MLVEGVVNPSRVRECDARFLFFFPFPLDVCRCAVARWHLALQVSSDPDPVHTCAVEVWIPQLLRGGMKQTLP